VAEGARFTRVDAITRAGAECEGLVRSGTIPDYASWRGGMGDVRPRHQIMNLLHLELRFRKILNWSEGRE